MRAADPNASSRPKKRPAVPITMKTIAAPRSWGLLTLNIPPHPCADCIARLRARSVDQYGATVHDAAGILHWSHFPRRTAAHFAGKCCGLRRLEDEQMKFSFFHLMPWTDLEEAPAQWPASNAAFVPERGKELYDSYIA